MSLQNVPIEIRRIDRPQGPCWTATRNTVLLATFEDEQAARMFQAGPQLLAACEAVLPLLDSLANGALPVGEIESMACDAAEAIEDAIHAAKGTERP